MTNREFLNAVVALGASEEITAYAQTEIEKLDERNRKRSSKPSKAAIANAPLKEKILEAMAEHGYFASGLVEVLGVSVQKASSLCRQLGDDGSLVVTDVKVPKKGVQKFYSLPTEEE